MFQCQVETEQGLKWVRFEGRIDGISATEVEKTLSALMLEGERVIGADFGKVNYISSAGLRVFLKVQKQLGRVGGEIILALVSPFIAEIFEMSGFHNLFRIAATREQAGRGVDLGSEPSEMVSLAIEGIDLRYLETEAGKGTWKVFGDSKKLAEAGYADEDVVKVQSTDMAFAVGLGTVGAQYQDYKNLFGEAMIFNGNLYFYPAVKNPVVDYMVGTQENSVLEYNFFHGFGFNGSFKYLISFQGIHGFVELDQLVDTLFKVSEADVLGMVLLGESKGVWGMHLKQVPIMENKPGNEKNILDGENFSDWLSFPVEPSDINHVVAGTGMAIRRRDTGPPALQAAMAEESNFHFHGGIFSPEPLSKKPEQFEHEYHRVFMELDLQKIQHLLGRTRFSSGMAGIVELEG